MKKIIMTGGGTAGHVTPNIALMDRLREEGYEIYYIGSKDGIEKKLIENLGIPYYGVSTGKFRRYFSMKNLTDPIRVQRGLYEAKLIIKEIDPDICFSKGGFVSVPVVVAARMLKVPVIIHESDMTPGLANKLAFPNATKICCNFPETLAKLPAGKGVHTGTPIRKELFTGTREDALKFCGFDKALNEDGSSRKDYPVLLVVGGSTGALSVNEAIWSILPKLLAKFNVIHLCGKDKANHEKDGLTGYCQIEYCDKEMKDMLAAADVVVSRAGANAICELLALRKPNILIPLSAKASRGDQIINAESFEKQGFSKVLADEAVNDESLYGAIEEVYHGKDKYIAAMNESKISNAEEIIIGLINENARVRN